MEYVAILRARIRALCDEREITINKLADMSGVRQSTLDNIMRCVTKNPTMKTMHRIANAFSMTLSEFLNDNEINRYCFDEEDTDGI